MNSSYPSDLMEKSSLVLSLKSSTEQLRLPYISPVQPGNMSSMKENMQSSKLVWALAASV